MQISLFQRYKAYINSLSIGETYTTDDLYKNVGCHESSTWWKKLNKQRMYRTSTYQTYLKRLGALHKVKRGTWKVLHHIPEWFYSKHMNYLLGYETCQWNLDYMLDQGFPRELAERVHIPKHERQNPFKNATASRIAAAVMASTPQNNQATIDIDLLKSLYASANTADQKKMRIEYPELFDKYSLCYNFGKSITIKDDTFNGTPLMIAKGLAPEGLAYRSFVVASNYKVVITDACSDYHSGTKILYFEEII